jgi:hypothetical protein
MLLELSDLQVIVCDKGNYARFLRWEQKKMGHFFLLPSQKSCEKGKGAVPADKKSGMTHTPG